MCPALRRSLQKQNVSNEYFVINLEIRWEFYLKIFITIATLNKSRCERNGIKLCCTQPGAIDRHGVVFKRETGKLKSVENPFNNF